MLCSSVTAGPFAVCKQEEEKIDPVVKAPELYEAVKDNNAAAALSLLEEMGPPSHCDQKDGVTCLSWAVRHGNIKLVKALIEKGGSSHYHHAKKMQQLDPSADVQEELSEKIILNSPLLLAAYKGFMNITWALLADGFSPDDVEKLDNNAVHLAAAAGHDKVVNLLVASGADINVFNKFRNTAVDIAISKESHDLLLAERERRAANPSYSSEVAYADLLKKVYICQFICLYEPMLTSRCFITFSTARSTVW